LLLHPLDSKGIARSAAPFRKSAPSWCKTDERTVVDEIVKFAKKGLTPSQIGVLLRDSHGIPSVKAVTGSKILRVLKVQGW
jgi:small subunit ribosomal protein S13e